MARTAEGWKLYRQNGVWIARFTLAGRRYNRSTGEQDKAGAARRAAVLYAEAQQGKLDPPQVTGDALLVDLFAEWIVSLESGYTPGTRNLWKLYARAHWLSRPRWERLSDLTEAAIGDYQRERLGVVTRVTVTKERTALRRFGEWAKERGYLAAPLVFPRLPSRTPGVRRPGRKAKATDLDEADIAALLAVMPERSSKPGKDGRLFWVRPFFEFLWETGLRPVTVEALVLGVHWTRGASLLTITPDIDKARFGRDVPLTPRAVEVLSACAGQTGEPIFGAHDWRDPLETAARASGLPSTKRKTLSVYDLRHARISHWVDHGSSLAAVAYLAGHRQVTTTAIYTHGTAKAAARVVQATRRRGGWARSPAPLRRLPGAWDCGQDSGQGHKTTDARVGARASILLRVLAVCAKEGT